MASLLVHSAAHAETTHASPVDCEAACQAQDSDGDGILDEVELSTGTSPWELDTDGDSVPDGVEDANRDGIVDEGESDPRVPGLFPGRYPYIPEPMVFDLVRGLGARRGELEVNALIVTHIRRTRPIVHWAPEIEWAIVDNFAIELELPLDDRHLSAVKLAGQVTLPSKPERFIHGIQLIGEHLIIERETETTLLYLIGGRVRHWAFFSMLGARSITPMNLASNYEAILNPSVTYDVSERFTLGLETNVAVRFETRDTAVKLIPQFHAQLNKQVRIQFGGGVQFLGRSVHPIIATRLIME